MFLLNFKKENIFPVVVSGLINNDSNTTSVNCDSICFFNGS